MLLDLINLLTLNKLGNINIFVKNSYLMILIAVYQKSQSTFFGIYYNRNELENLKHQKRYKKCIIWVDSRNVDI